MFVFVSDVHLNRPHEKRYEAFLFFLEKLKKEKELTHLFLMGDIFDLWLGSSEFYYQKHKAVIESLKELSQNVEIHFFEGNHDYLLKNQFESWGFKVHPEHHVIERDGKKFFLSHGDLLNRKDYGYRLLRGLLRGFFGKFLMTVLPSKAQDKIGQLMSSTEYKKEVSKEQKEKFIRSWTKWIEDFRSKNSWDYFICGHYHYKIFDAPEGAFNLGSWLSEPFEFLVYKNGAFEFKKLS